MPDVGVLNLQIHDDSDEAGKGLDHLAGALRAVKSATSGFSLSKVTQSIKSMVEGVRDSMPVVKQLSTLFNAINSFSKIKSFNINTDQIEGLKNAVTGFNIGNAGSQMKALREALSGSWNTKSTDNAVTAMGKLQGAASGWQQSGTAATVSAVARAIEKYAAAHSKLPNDSPFHNVSVAIQQEANTTRTAVDQIKQHVQEVKDAAAGDWRSAMNGGVQEVATAYHSMIFKESKTKTSDYWSIGADITKGLQEGIEQGKSGVASASLDIARSAHRTIADELEIHSPSRVTHEQGENVSQGLANGMRDKVGEVRSAAQELTNAVKDAINGATIVEGTFANSAAEVRTATGAYDAFGRSIGKASTTMKNVSDTVQSIDYSKLNINDYVASPVESIMSGFRNAGNSVDAFKDRISTSIPVFREYRDTVLGLESKKDIAGFSRKTTDELLAGEKAVAAFRAVREAIEEAIASEGKLVNTTELASQAIEKVGAAAQKIIFASDSPLRLGDGTTPGQLLLGDGSDQQTFLSTWVDTAQQWKQNWAYYSKEAMEEMNAQWKPDWTFARESIDKAKAIEMAFQRVADLKNELFYKIETGQIGQEEALKVAAQIDAFEKQIPIVQDIADTARDYKAVEDQIVSSVNKEVVERRIANNEALRNQRNMEKLASLQQRLSTMTEREKIGTLLSYKDDPLMTDALRTMFGMADAAKTATGEINSLNQATAQLSGTGTLSSVIGQAQDGIGPATTQLMSYKDAMAGVNAMVNTVSASRANAIGNMLEYQAKLEELKLTENQLRDELAHAIMQGNMSNDELLRRVVAIRQVVAAEDELKRKMDELSKSQSIVSRIGSSVSSAFHNLGSVMERMFPTTTRLIKQFVRMAKMRMIRAAIRQIAEGFREGVQNVYQYSQAIGGSFAPAMDSAASALLQMKNSIGAMAAPLIEALIPALQTVVGWVVNAVNWFNQLFSLLAGKNSWTRAKTAITTAFEDQTKATRGASKAMKDLLADWDELNIIQSESGGGGGAGAVNSAIKPEDMFEEVYDFEESTKGVAQFIDSLGGVEAVVKGIGAAFLTWKLRKPLLLGLFGVKSLLGKIKDYIEGLKQTTNPPGQAPQTTGNEPSVKNLEPRTEAKQPETVKTETKRLDDQATKTASEKLENVNDNIKRMTDTTEQFKDDIKRLLPDQTEFKNLVEPAKRLGTGNGTPFNIDNNIMRFMNRELLTDLPSGMELPEVEIEIPAISSTGSSGVGLQSGVDIEVDVTGLMNGAVQRGTEAATGGTQGLLGATVRAASEATAQASKAAKAASEVAADVRFLGSSAGGTGGAAQVVGGSAQVADGFNVVTDGNSFFMFKPGTLGGDTDFVYLGNNTFGVIPSELDKTGTKEILNGKIWAAENWASQHTGAIMGSMMAAGMAAQFAQNRFEEEKAYEELYGERYTGKTTTVKAVTRATGSTPEIAEGAVNFAKAELEKLVPSWMISAVEGAANIFDEATVGFGGIVKSVNDAVDDVDKALEYVTTPITGMLYGLTDPEESKKIMNNWLADVFQLAVGWAFGSGSSTATAVNETSKPSKSIQRGFNVLDPEILEMARADAKANIPVSWSDSEVFNYLSDYWGNEGIAIFDEIIRYLNDLDEQLYGTWSWRESGGSVAAMEDVLKASYAGIVQGVSSMGIPNASGLYRVDQTGASTMYATGGFPGATDEADMEKAMRNGSKDANSELESNTAEMTILLRKILAKNFNITISPSSSWGFHTQQSNEMANEVTGYNA